MAAQPRTLKRRLLRHAWALCGTVLLPAAVFPSIQEVRRARSAEGADALSLRLEEVLVIGSFADEKTSFGRIRDIAWDSRGRLLVADGFAHHFKVFGPDGAYVRTVGREGEGPGEFSAPAELAVDASDSVYVWDAEQARIHVFAPDLVFVRDFIVPPAWQVNSMMVMDPDRIVLTGMAAGEQHAIKVLDKDGAILQEAGPRIDLPDLPMYIESLFGGTLARSRTGFVYSNKSPWSVAWLDEDLRAQRICRGPPGWTTTPEDMVVQTGRTIELQWNRYVYSSLLLSLPNGFVLNVVRDPISNVRTWQVVTDECVVATELDWDFRVIPAASHGDLIAASRDIGYPEVVVYRATVEPRSAGTRDADPASAETERGARVLK